MTKMQQVFVGLLLCWGGSMYACVPSDSPKPKGPTLQRKALSMNNETGSISELAQKRVILRDIQALSNAASDDYQNADTPGKRFTATKKSPLVRSLSVLVALAE